MTTEKTKQLPPLTAMDWQNFVSMLLGITVLGAVVIDVHPARWPLICQAAATYGGAIPPHVDLTTITRLPLDIEVGGLPLRCVLRLWEPCPKPLSECPGCAAIAAQQYPEPEPESLVVLPTEQESQLVLGRRRGN